MLGMSFPAVDWGVKLCFQSQHYKWALLTDQIAAKSISLQRRWCSGSWKGHGLNHLQINYCHEGSATAEGCEGEESDVHISISGAFWSCIAASWVPSTVPFCFEVVGLPTCPYTCNRGTFVWWEIFFPPEMEIYTHGSTCTNFLLTIFYKLSLKRNRKYHFTSEFVGCTGRPGGSESWEQCSVLWGWFSMCRFLSIRKQRSCRVCYQNYLLSQAIREPLIAVSDGLKVNRNGDIISLPDFCAISNPAPDLGEPKLGSEPLSSGKPLHWPRCPSCITALVTSGL